ncbi:hypothetical protein N0Y54_07790 [Nostoc punctiforme UO1]|uniref:hypothetical protein n=1 Tax=Nostoc punctiforme TaxID=272131 RepID=UPI003098E306
MTSKNTAQISTRLLLALWDLGGTQQEVKKGQLTKRIVSKSQKVADYQSSFEELQNQGAIAISKKGYSLTSPKGLEVLGEGLRGGDFKFEGTIVGTWAANALVKWISQIDVAVTGADVPVNGVKSAIASYDEFKPEILDLFDTLNTTSSYSGLVPIWHLRQTLGKRVSLDNFNNWMMAMQSEQLFYLQSGEARGATEEQKRNSINSDIRGLLFFASKPS